MLRPYDYRDSKVSRVLSHEFGVVRLYRTFSIYIVTDATRYAGCCAQMMWFEVVQAHRTCSNLLEPHHYKDSKVCRVLSHEFGVGLRPSLYIEPSLVKRIEHRLQAR